MTPKRSIIYDEIGARLGRGRKTGVGDRDEVRAPAGVSVKTKQVALERAKMLVVHRHFKELLEIYDNEVTFLQALDEWAPVVEDKKVSERGFTELLAVTRRYYEKHGLHPVVEEAKPITPIRPTEPAVQPAIFLPSGKLRPRKKASSE